MANSGAHALYLMCMNAVFPAPGTGSHLRRSSRLSHRLNDDSADNSHGLFDHDLDIDKKRTRTDRRLFMESSDEEDNAGECQHHHSMIMFQEICLPEFM